MKGWELFNTIAYWLIRITYLNFVWIFFVVIGLGLFGLFPATVALFTITRQWLIEKDLSLRIFKKFFTIYRRELIKSNVFGLFFIVIAYIIYIDYMFVYKYSSISDYFIPVIALISFMYLAFVCFFFPVYVNFNLKFWQYMKQTFLIALASPVPFVIILMCLLAFIILAYFIPGIIPLYTGSGLALVITYITQHAIQHIHSKQQLNE